MQGLGKSWRKIMGIGLSVAMLATSVQPIGVLAAEESGGGTASYVQSVSGSDVAVDNHLTALTDEGSTYKEIKVKLNEKATLKVNVTADNMEGITYQWYSTDPDNNYLMQELPFDNPSRGGLMEQKLGARIPLALVTTYFALFFFVFNDLGISMPSVNYSDR